MKFLQARLDEDEQAARAADSGPWEVGPRFGARNTRVYVRQQGDLIDSIGTCVIAGQVSNKPRCRENAIHIARHDPARVLADVEVKRAMMQAHGRAVLRAAGGAQYYDTVTVCRSCEPPRSAPETAWPCETLRLLTLPYAGHPDYDQEWRL